MLLAGVKARAYRSLTSVSANLNRSAVQLGVLQVGCILFLGCDHSSTAPRETPFREKWYQPQADYGLARPAVFGPTVYFGAGNGFVYARDISTGVPRWAVRVGTQRISGLNLVARSGVVVAPVVSYTVGLDAQTGQQLWRYDAPSDTIGHTGNNPGQVSEVRIDADDGTVYIPAWGASISAVDIHSGSPRWIWQPGKIEGDTAASGFFRSGAMGVRLSGDTLFATMWHYVNRLGGTSEAWVVALNRTSGKELWRTRLPYQGSGVLIEAPPALYGNLVIVHTLSARTYAIDRATRQVVWEFTVSGAHSTIAGAEVFADAVYVDAGDGNIYALRAETGAQIWRSSFATQTTNDLLVTNRRIIFSNGVELYVIDRITGNRIALTTQPRTTDSFFASAAAFSNGFVFITVGDAAWCFEEP